MSVHIVIECHDGSYINNNSPDLPTQVEICSIVVITEENSLATDTALDNMGTAPLS